MKHKFLRLTVLASYVGIAALAASCSKKKEESSGGGSKKVTYKGTSQLKLSLAKDESFKNFIKGIQLQADITADTLQAFIISSGVPYYPYDNSKYTPATIGADGTFKFSMDPDDAAEVVLALINSQAAERIDQVVGYVGFSDPTVSANLIKLPVPEEEGTTVDVGTQTANDAGEATSDKALADMQDSFSVDAGILREVAKTNGTLKNLKNIYANIDTTTGTKYTLETSFYFNYDATTSDKNAWIAATNMAYTGLNFNISTNNSAIGFDALCSLSTASGHKTYALKPPSAVTTETKSSGSTTTTTVSSFNNDSFVAGDIDSTSCGNSDFYTSKQSGTTNVTFASGQIRANSIPEGNWTLEYDGSKVATFDVNTAKPVDENGKIAGYVPSFYIEVDGSNYITKISVKLNVWNKETSAFDAVTDLTTFGNQVSSPSIGMFDFGKSPRVTDSTASMDGGESADWKTFVSDGVFSFTPTKQFKFQNCYSSSGANCANTIVFQYKTNGIQMFYSLVPPQ